MYTYRYSFLNGWEGELAIYMSCIFSVWFTYRIFPFEAFDFFCSCTGVAVVGRFHVVDRPQPVAVLLRRDPGAPVDGVGLSPPSKSATSTHSSYRQSRGEFMAKRCPRPHRNLASTRSEHLLVGLLAEEPRRRDTQSRLGVTSAHPPPDDGPAAAVPPRVTVAVTGGRERPRSGCWEVGVTPGAGWQVTVVPRGYRASSAPRSVPGRLYDELPAWRNVFRGGGPGLEGPYGKGPQAPKGPSKCMQK